MNKLDYEKLKSLITEHGDKISKNGNYIYIRFINTKIYSAADTIEVLGYTIEDINSNEKLLHGLKKACNDIMKEEE